MRKIDYDVLIFNTICLWSRFRAKRRGGICEADRKSIKTTIKYIKIYKTFEEYECILEQNRNIYVHLSSNIVQ